MISACVFLGNPGLRYMKTRHNAGWMTADCLDILDKQDWQEKFLAWYQMISVKDRKILFLKPLTMMNLSGKSVRRALDFFKLQPEDLLCVHDDLESEFGTIVLKCGGGLAGHNGLKSLRQHLGTADFYRIKIGISRPSRGSVSDWVLSRFSPDEEAVLPLILERAAGLVQDLLSGGIISEEKITVTE